MASSIATLKALAPQYASEPDDTLEVFLSMAAEQMDAEAWGTLYQQGAAYLAAHLLTLRDRGQQAAGHGGAAGAVTSVSEGDQSIGYAGGSSTARTPTEEALSSTTYGEQYLQLRGQLASTAGFVADGSH